MKNLSLKETVCGNIDGKSMLEVLHATANYCESLSFERSCFVTVQNRKKEGEEGLRVYASILYLNEEDSNRSAYNQWLFNVDEKGFIFNLQLEEIPLIALLYMAKERQLFTVHDGKICSRKLFTKNQIFFKKGKDLIPNCKIAALMIHAAIFL